ncbi:translation initiation factor eIF4A [Mortierella sp. NVP85]|nr:translation initiation factor eIF4A [Mortierella sp. NVP85]
MSSSTTTSYSTLNEIETDWDEVIDRFEDMDLSPELVRGIIEPIHKYAIPAILKKRDVLVQQSSRSIEKFTATVPAIQSIDKSDPQCQVIIITPTRELAMHTAWFLSDIGQYAAVNCYAVTGGTNIPHEISELSKGRQIIAGTPGRITDMIQRGALRTEHIRMVVLDDVDEILSRGVRDQIVDLFKLLPSNRQVVMTTDTIHGTVDVLVNQMMQDPVRILRNMDRVMLQRASQFYIDCTKREWKLDTLYDLIEILPITQAVIFCNTDRTVDWLGSQLRRAGHNVLTINSNMEHAHREVILIKYRRGLGRFLVATDLPHGRRINMAIVVQVGVIINFDMSFNKLNYVRRLSGSRFRTNVINFVTTEDQDIIKEIETFFATKIVESPMNLADYL